MVLDPLDRNWMDSGLLQSTGAQHLGTISPESLSAPTTVLCAGACLDLGPGPGFWVAGHVRPPWGWCWALRPGPHRRHPPVLPLLAMADSHQ
ncbi:hypothetical protein GDO81_006387 [Engystomops pustulosus]|uniref:Uncharacterized protein n=1 Tax=Engystomops pustulosus TaxID=76066 RepID=A0AAV7CXL5_ENGPU|nr:hypothetical protein GDO81_006387 [Engystomops pustulosus]